MIKVENLKKNYQVFKRSSGIANAIRSIFHRQYESVEAIKGISLSIGEGEFVGFIGPNGAGKTTTLKILAGILFPSEGNVSINGFIPCKKEKQFLRQIAFLTAQKNSLWWDIPAKDSFLIHKVIYEISDKNFKNRVAELAELLKVSSLLEIPVRNLSLGERMKMEIIMAILHEPKLIFLDEPTIGLDFISRQQIREFLTHYQKIHKATIILTSHYFEDIVQLCKRLIVINKGTIVIDSNLSCIQKKYEDYKVAKVRSNHLEKYRQQFQEEIIEESLEFIEILLPQARIMKIIQNGTDDEFEIKPVSLEAMIKKHYVG